MSAMIAFDIASEPECDKRYITRAPLRGFLCQPKSGTRNTTLSVEHKDLKVLPASDFLGRSSLTLRPKKVERGQAYPVQACHCA